MLEDAIRRLRVLIFTRALVVTLLLGSFYVFQVEGLKLLSLSIFSYFIVSLYALTIIYAASLRFINKLSSFTVLASIQIFIDVITEAILVYLTGGIESWFAFTFLLTIISASVVLNRQVSFYAASLSSILYGVIMEFQFYGILPTYTGNIFNARDYLYNIFIYITAFYLVAILSGYLAERLRVVTQTLKKRDEYIDNLKTLSKDIVESMPSGVFTTDLNWRIVTFNVSAQKITGRTIAEVIGKTPQYIFPFLENTHDPFDRIEGKIQRQDKTIHIGIRFSRLENSEGMPIGMIGVFQDLTKVKTMEKEMQKKEKWAVVGELSALIAHELRNPLASLKASVEMLRDKKTSEQHGEQLMKIALSEMDRLNGIVTDFLIYAKPQQPRKDSIDLHQSLRDLVTMLRSSITNKKDVKISGDFDGELLMTVDSRQLQQVFWNLGINAIDAISDSGEIFISTGRKDNAVEVIFRDTGKGINAKDIDKIFYPFFTTKEEGTGLGLAIAQRITEEHGGKIKVESQGPGTGTTFRIILFFDKAKNSAKNIET